nr:lasso peptide biosynthesis PqqD family chaperone [Streptomyces sp. SID5468]
MVLLDERSGRYWQLNATGATVLEALLDTGDEALAAAALRERCPSAGDRAERDVGRLVAMLRDAGLVVS